jgi:hypothetical protein
MFKKHNKNIIKERGFVGNITTSVSYHTAHLGLRIINLRAGGLNN